MKKFSILILTIFSAFTLSACSGGAALPSYSTPWNTNNNTYEQATYVATRSTVSGTAGAYLYDEVAAGTQVVTLKEDVSKKEVTFTVERDLTYTRDEKVTEEQTIAKGTNISYFSQIVFSTEATKMMQVKTSQKKIVNEADPSTDLDYTAVYDVKNGLTITDKLHDNAETKIAAKKIKNKFDSDMWYMLVRYATKFGVSYSGSMALISIADTLYTGKLTTFSLTASAAAAAFNLPLSSLDANIQLGSNDYFAQESEETPGTFFAPSLTVSMSEAGELGSIRGPAISASYITDRRVDRLPLANLMLTYTQNEYASNGLFLYSNRLDLKTATISEA